MKHKKHTLTTLMVLQAGMAAWAQSPVADTGRGKFDLNEVIISANKVRESKIVIPQQVITMNRDQIAQTQSQTTADLVAATGNVFVQKSQMGAGSPVMRGFEANRIVLQVDGVRMNNIIYRGGHLQNIITVDNAMLDRAEILFGPSSTVYGSDALGGVINFYTKNPVFSGEAGKLKKEINAFTRYGSVNNEMTGHADFAIGGNKFASLTSFTYSSFDDLKSGKAQNPLYDTSYGNRIKYVDRINGVDSLLVNSDQYKQVESGYKQYDILQKFSFKQNEHITHGLNLQFSNSTDIPRYDRLTDPAGSGLRYAKWYYGPQTRLLGAYDYNNHNDAAFFQNIHAGLNYQAIEESRHTRSFNKTGLSHRVEKVNVAGLNIDLQRTVKQHNIRIGVDGQYNTLKSTATSENISTGKITPLDTRYPDGDNTLTNVAAYASHTWKISDKFTMTDGLRLGMVALHSTFSDSSFFHLPFREANQNNFVYSGSAGIIHTPTDKWKLSLLVSTGFRAPNVDDLAKVFESASGTLIVPNADLKPEKTINTELGITKLFGTNTLWESSVYYTRFADAIVTDKFKYEGLDSVLYNGTMSRVLANQNKRTAYVYGFSTNLKSQLSNSFVLSLAANYTYGR
ncbi:MAG: TonB-dependent receptor, partial [Taibaiella sp.]|nr:TonB-dependent receptor [Taibaiella sp.]